MSKEVLIQKLQMRVALGWLRIMEDAQKLVDQQIDVARNMGIVRNARDKYCEAFQAIIQRATDQMPTLDLTEKFYHLGPKPVM